MLTVVLGLTSSLSYALSDMVSQHVARRTGVVRVVFWVLATGVVLVVPLLFIVEGASWHGEGWGGVGYAALAGVVYIGAYFCLLAGFKRGDLSLVAALSSSQGAFAAVFAVLGGERLGLLMATGLVLAIAGGVLAAVQGRAKSAAGAGWALASGLLFALVMVAYDHADGLTWLSTAAISRAVSFALFVPVVVIVLAWERRAPAPAGSSAAIPAAASSAGLPSPRLPQGLLLPPRLLGLAVVAGVFEIVGLVLVAASIMSGPLAVAGVMASQFATFATVLGVVLLGERPRWWQLVGVALTIAGVSILGVFSAPG
jgi:drug/metabolite transporter (DMT)-like permease